MGLLRPRETWLNAHLVAYAFPRSETALASLASQGVTLLVNLHERSHVPERLARYGICEVHFPTCDFTPPAKRDLDEGIAAIEQAVAEGRRVAVHCGGGLGRTGTLLACYLVHRGFDADSALAQIRKARPGAVETKAQAEAVRAFFADRLSKRTR